MSFVGDLHLRERVPVAILGATGAVGQKFAELLAEHPWFKVVSLTASNRSAGRLYGESVDWQMAAPLSPSIARIPITSPEEIPDGVSLAFSGLSNSVAGEIEQAYARHGILVISNTRHHRMDPNLPLILPEVNGEALQMLANAPLRIVTNPNCVVAGLAMAFAPLRKFHIDAAFITTMQALSGAGLHAAKRLDIEDNVIPYIADEEEKIQQEIAKILGPVRVSAHCNRVPVSDGHMACVSIKFATPPCEGEIIEAWNSFRAEPQQLLLPTAPQKPIHYLAGDAFPQPKLHRDIERGMAVSIGRLRRCTLYDYKFVILSHNTVRGAAGSALLNAELALKKGFVFW